MVALSLFQNNPKSCSYAIIFSFGQVSAYNISCLIATQCNIKRSGKYNSNINHRTSVKSAFREPRWYELYFFSWHETYNSRDRFELKLLLMFHCYTNQLLHQFKLNSQLTLREKCPYLKFSWSVFSRIWTEYGEILSIYSYSVHMRENMDQIIPKSKIIPVVNSLHLKWNLNLDFINTV